MFMWNFVEMEVYNLGRVICKPSATPNWGEPKENDQALGLP
jgi:hypothetical protein